MPAYGNPFVTEGYIYPADTLDGTNGVLANGDPEFPDLVIGKWVCRGYMIGDGAHTETGVWVVSTQTYDLGENPGDKILCAVPFEEWQSLQVAATYTPPLVAWPCTLVS